MMASLSEFSAVTVNGQAVSLQEALMQAFWREELGFLNDAADAVLIRQAARERGITVTDAELQQAADTFRVARGLYKANAMQDWLTTRGRSIEDWEAYLEYRVLASKVRQAITEGKVEQFFAENKAGYDAATISQITTADEGVAEELRSQIVDDGADFYALARKYSTDAATKCAGGYVGILSRSVMAPVMAAAVFGARPGEVIGPIKTEQGFTLVKVEAHNPAQLNSATREAIQATLFDQWLREQRGKAQITQPVLEAL